MTRRNSVHRTSIVWIAVAALLISPVRARAARVMAGHLPATIFYQDPQDVQEKEQERREREEEAREKEQEKREREQEAREREQEKIERFQELYDDGREALDEDRYDKAEAKFDQLAQMNGPQTDAALYWKAYAQNRLGKKAAALSTIAELKTKFAQSRWKKDAEALEIEVRQSSGQKPNPEAESDKDLKILALQALLNSDPQRAMPIVEKVLNGSSSPKDKAKVLFLVAQTGSPQGMQVLANIARGQSNPELQRKAVEYLGIFGGVSGGIEGGVEGGVKGGVTGPTRNRGSAKQILAEVYASSGDASVKRAVLRSYMLSGDRQNLFAAAKSEKDEGLRREAIRQLGLVHGTSELEQLYQTETSTEIRREILQAFFLAGDAKRLVDAAQGEKDPDLRRTAIRNLGLVHSDDSAKALQTIYSKETDRGLKEEVLNAYFLQGNASAIVAVARNEKDPELKRVAVQKLSLMHSKEATDYLMEILQK
jgi:hypothetical protein